MKANRASPLVGRGALSVIVHLEGLAHRVVCPFVVLTELRRNVGNPVAVGPHAVRDLHKRIRCAVNVDERQFELVLRIEFLFGG